MTDHIATNHPIELEDYIEVASPPKQIPTKDTNPTGHDEPQEPLPLPERRRTNLRIISMIAALYLSLFAAALDATIVSTALPTISSHFKSAAGYTWIGGAYLLANAATGPIWAKLSDIWGRKFVLLSAIALFLLSSIVCAVAQTMVMLIAGRAVQGMASGGIVLLVNVVISDIFDLRRRSLLLGSLEFVWAVAGAIGPVVGGALAQFVSWRWIWYINIPITGLAFAIIFVSLDVHNPKTKLWDGIKAIDWFGSVSLLALTLMTLLGLDFGGQTFPWNSPTVLCLLIIGGIFMSALFLLSEAKLAQYPLIPLGIFRNRSVVASMMIGFVHGMATFGAIYYLPLYFQSTKAMSPVRSGLMILPFVVIEASIGVIVGVIIHRTSRYLALIWAGVILMTLGFGLLIDLDASSGPGKFIPYQFVAAIGAGLLLEPPLIVLQSVMPQTETAAATATFGFTREFANALSVVLGGVIFQNRMSRGHSHLLAAGLSKDTANLFSGNEAAANVMLVGSLKDPRQIMAVQNMFAAGLREMWIFYTSLAAVGIVAAGFVGVHEFREEHVETQTGLKKEEARVS